MSLCLKDSQNRLSCASRSRYSGFHCAVSSNIKRQTDRQTTGLTELRRPATSGEVQRWTDLVLPRPGDGDAGRAAAAVLLDTYARRATSQVRGKGAKLREAGSRSGRQVAPRTWRGLARDRACARRTRAGNGPTPGTSPPSPPPRHSENMLSIAFWCCDVLFWCACREKYVHATPGISTT